MTTEPPYIAQLGELAPITKTVFISPVNITANGRAHLGHASGPYLRMDVLARHLKRAGHRVFAAMSTDGFENHVVVRAINEGVSPAEMAHHYSRDIAMDLKALGISYDLFEDPGYGTNVVRFGQVQDSLVEALDACGALLFRETQLPIHDNPGDIPISTESFCIGGWLSAECPHCGASAGSFFCEVCGHHFEPAEARNPTSRTGTITGWRSDVTAFLSLASSIDLPGAWEAMHIDPYFKKIAQRYICHSGQTMRLSVPGNYGMAWRSSKFSSPQISFSYSSLMYVHSIYCGERLREISVRNNPMAENDDSFLISATGIDNTIPMLIGVTGCALAQNRFRPFDRIYFNHFMNLEGSKFSTSRRHVIWCGDLVRIPGLNSDVLRLYLAERCPEEMESNISVDDLVARYNALFEVLERRIQQAVVSLHGITAPFFDDAAVSRLRDLYEAQNVALSLDRLRVSHAVAPLESWLSDFGDLRDVGPAYTWLKGLALLGMPLMPELSSKIWRWLGHKEEILNQHFFKKPTISASASPMISGRILSTAELVNGLSMEHAS